MILTVRLYLDIETFSEGEFRVRNTKVISIQYKDSDGNITVLKEWESNEKTILKRFHDHLLKLKNTGFIVVIGHNLLRFDIPILIHRMAVHNIDTYENLLDLHHSHIIAMDSLQCLLPFNDFQVKGLNAVELSRRLKIRAPKHKSTEIAQFYRNGQYDKIEEHILADLDFMEDLWRKLREKGSELHSLPST
jgi:DNA polymerase elongation subunit (family B)